MNLGVSCPRPIKNLFLEHYSKYFNDLLSGERSLPFGLLVFLVNVCFKKERYILFFLFLVKT